MAQNYNLQFQYPSQRSNGYTIHPLQQPPSSLYPDNQLVDRTSTATPDPSQHAQRHPYAAYQQPADVYQTSRGQIGGPQLARYPSVQTQVPQPSSERHSPFTAQPAGLPRHRVQVDSVPVVQTSTVPSERYRPQARRSPLPRPATTAPQMQATNDTAHYTYTPPTSPVRASQLRRPLPQRPGDVSNNVLGRRPLPGASSPPVVASSLHRPSFSMDASSTSPSPGFFVSSPASHDGIPPQFSPPRPLPDPIPRSTKSLDLTRSPSPMKQTLETVTPLPKAGQKFVPLWKRSLPTPTQPTPMLTHTVSSDGRSTPSGPPIHAPVLQRSKTAAVRPLPPSPGRSQAFNTPQPSLSQSTFAKPDSSSPSKTLSTSASQERSRIRPEARPAPQGPLPHRPSSLLPSPRTLGAAPFPAPAIPNRVSVADSSPSSDSEDMYDNPLLQRPEKAPSTSSPTYGIRDLPPRLPNGSTDNVSPLNKARDQQPSDLDYPPDKPQSGGPRSMVSRIAALTLTRPPQLEQSPPKPSGSPPKPIHTAPVAERKTQSGAPRWPPNLPPLPRAPQQVSGSDPHKSPAPVNGAQYVAASTSWESMQRPQPSAPASLICPQLPRLPQRDASPTRPLPSAPQNSSGRNPSPVRSFPSLRHPSPIRSQPPPPLSSSQYEPSSPTRSQPRSTFLPDDLPRGRGLPQTTSYAGNTVPNLDDAPPPSLRRTPSPSRPSTFSSQGFQAYDLPNIRTQDVRRTPIDNVQLTSPPYIVTPTSAGSSTFSLSAFPTPPQISPGWSSSVARSPDQYDGPQVTLSTDIDHEDSQDYIGGPSIAIFEPDHLQQNAIPQIPLPGSDDDDTMRGPRIVVGNSNGVGPRTNAFDSKLYHQLRPVVEVDDYPACLGCGALIIGDAVNAMNGRWHPRCYRCCVCHESLEMLAPIEHEGKLYCNLDYHEKFSPRCYHCDTVIADPTYITLNDKEMGTRTYHDQHFFCSECGDPFVTPGMKNRTFEGDGPFEGGEVGAAFTVFRGFPYCAKCHAKLRWPKCKQCRKSMAPDSDIIEALGAKWCSDCFVCTGCRSPFRNGRLFLRDNKPFCQDCFELMIKNEM